MSVVPAILLAVDADGIATLTLNRPDQLNAFDLEMVDAWRAALEQAEADAVSYTHLTLPTILLV